MEKTYKFISHETPLDEEELRRLYKGYWVFITNTTFGEHHKLISGIPAVIGNKAYDGASDGIYAKYDSPEYGHCADLNLLPNRGFISALRFVGEERPA